MIDAALIPLQRRALRSPAAWLAARGVTPDSLTLGGFAIGLVAVVLLAFGLFALALAPLLFNRLLDGLDGAVARIVGPTDRGAFLDIALDFAFYAALPLGFALADPAVNALPAAVLIAAFVGTGSSFLAFAVLAAKRGETALSYPAKGIYYLGGLTEGFETITIFVVMCLFPHHFAPLAYGFAVACGITTLMRWRQGWIAFSPNARRPH